MVARDRAAQHVAGVVIVSKTVQLAAPRALLRNISSYSMLRGCQSAPCYAPATSLHSSTP